MKEQNLKPQEIIDAWSEKVKESSQETEKRVKTEGLELKNKLLKAMGNYYKNLLIKTTEYQG